MKRQTDFARHLTRFLSHYIPHQRNLSARTISSYGTSFYLFLSFIKEVLGIEAENVTLNDFNRSNVSAFMDWLGRTRKCSPSYINNRRAAMCSFAKYLQYEVVEKLSVWQTIMGIPSLKSVKKQMKYLSMESTKTLFEQIDTTTAHGRRNMALLSLMYNTGCRVQELIDLTPSSLRLESGAKTICIKGKGNKSRIVPLLDSQLGHLEAYMQENNLHSMEKATSPLFFNSRGEKLTRAGVSFILREYVAKAHALQPEVFPEDISCHSLRHSRAMHLLQEGCPLIYIRDLLGHVTIQTTEIYARADSQQKRHAIENAYRNLTPDSSSEAVWEKDPSILDWLDKLKRT